MIVSAGQVSRMKATHWPRSSSYSAGLGVVQASHSAWASLPASNDRIELSSHSAAASANSSIAQQIARSVRYTRCNSSGSGCTCTSDCSARSSSGNVYPSVVASPKRAPTAMTRSACFTRSTSLGLGPYPKLPAYTGEFGEIASCRRNAVATGKPMRSANSWK